ncbi:MAG: YdcF family protein [Acidobacteria bacterium]|nr:MAG: YdcF family protein [Acidobacteriota bacterium]
MNDLSGSPPRRSHWFLRLLVVAVAALVLAIVVVSFHIVREADFQQTYPADAIVVFGAAEYAGRPSPVYRARLDHGFTLFQQGIAPVVITTGGAANDPSYSEGGVGHDYLMRRGIPERNLIAETQGADTAQSAARVAVILHANGMRSCVAVSDEYHVFRIQKLLEHEGVKVYVAPRPDSRPQGALHRAFAVLREAFSYIAWRLHLPT